MRNFACHADTSRAYTRALAPSDPAVDRGLAFHRGRRSRPTTTDTSSATEQKEHGHGTPDPHPGTTRAGPREGCGGAEEACRAQGRAQVREADAGRRADQIDGGHRGEDEGVRGPRVVARRRQGPRPEADGRARHLGEPSRSRTWREAARPAP